MAICKNCGAEIKEEDTVCSYCGAVQYKAADKEYWDQMQQIQDDLEKLKEMPQKEWKQEIGTQTKRIKKIVVIVTSIILICMAAGGTYSYISQKKESQRQKEQLIWQQETFAKLDAWYEEGNYDAIVEFHMQLLEEKSPYNLWSWEHMNLIECYEDFLIYNESVSTLEKEEVEEYELQYALEDILYVTFDMERQEKEFFSSEEEWKQVLEYRETVKKQTCEIFEWDDAEFDSAKEKICPDGYMDFEEGKEYAEQWLNQKKKR